MNLQNISNQELIQRLEKLVRTERKITHLVLLHILEIKTRKIYAELGFESLFAYLTKGLGYSESSAYRRIKSADLMRVIPEVADKLESGALNLSQLTQVQKCLNLGSGTSLDQLKPIALEHTKTILNKIENKNTFETDKILAVEFDQPLYSLNKAETVRPQKDDSIRLELTLTKQQFADLELARNLISHICPDGSWGDVIAALAKKFNASKMGSSKICNNQKRHTTKSDSITQSLSAKNSSSLVQKKSKSQKKLAGKSQIQTQKMLRKKSRKYISIQVKRSVFKKANFCCEYTDQISNKRCESGFHLEIDHIKPVAHGGSDHMTNLRLLCRTHNQFVAKQVGLNFRNKSL